MSLADDARWCADNLDHSLTLKKADNAMALLRSCADELDRLTAELAAVRTGKEQALFVAATEMERLEAKLAAAKKDANAKQAKIDALMLEWCPDEMTPEQLEEWGNRQQVAAQQEPSTSETQRTDSPESYPVILSVQSTQEALRVFDKLAGDYVVIPQASNFSERRVAYLSQPDSMTFGTVLPPKW
jgi:hypothetical protein